MPCESVAFVGSFQSGSNFLEFPSQRLRPLSQLRHFALGQTSDATLPDSLQMLGSLEFLLNETLQADCQIGRRGSLHASDSSKLEFRAHFLHLGLPLPLLPACSLNALIDPPQL